MPLRLHHADCPGGAVLPHRLCSAETLHGGFDTALQLVLFGVSQRSLVAVCPDESFPAGGRDSREKGSMPFLPVVTLAGRLGRDIAEFPGGHVGYAEHPGDFATQLGRLLGADR